MLIVKVDEDLNSRKLAKNVNQIQNSQSSQHIPTSLPFETSFSESVDHMEV